MTISKRKSSPTVRPLPWSIARTRIFETFSSSVRSTCLGAVRATILAINESDEDMEEAGSRYVDEAQHIAVDSI